MVGVPSPVPSSSSSTGQQQHLRKLNPNSQAFSFLQPDQLPPTSPSPASTSSSNGYPISSMNYDYPISSLNSTSYYSNSTSNSNSNPSNHSPYPISSATTPTPWTPHSAHQHHKMGNGWTGAPSTSATGGYNLYQSHSHSHSHSHHHPHSNSHSHAPYYHHHSNPAPPVPPPPPPPPAPPSHHRASNGIFLPLAHNGPHHLSSPAHSPYLGAPPPVVPLRSASPATFSPHQQYQRTPQPNSTPHPVPPPASIHVPTTPSLPVSPATPLPPPSTIPAPGTSFFASTPAAMLSPPPPPPPLAAVSQAGQLSFASAPRLPPSHIQQQAPAIYHPQLQPVASTSAGGYAPSSSSSSSANVDPSSSTNPLRANLAPTTTISQPPPLSNSTFNSASSPSFDHSSHKGSRGTTNERDPSSTSKPASRKSRLPHPKLFTAAVTLSKSISTPVGFVFPEGSSIGYGVPKVVDEKAETKKERKVEESVKKEEEKEEKQEKQEKQEKPKEEKENEVIVQEKVEPIVESEGEEKVEVKKPAKVEKKEEELKVVEPKEAAPMPSTSSTTRTPSSSTSSEAPSVAASSPATSTTATLAPPPTPTPAPAPAAVKPKSKSWADLVRPPAGSTPLANSSGVTPISATLASAPPAPAASAVAAPVSTLLSALAAPPSHVHKPSSPLPRGLINNGNLCFANAILQALVYCGAFWETLRAVEKGSSADLRTRGQKGRSAVEAMIAFLAEFRNPSNPSSTPFNPNQPNPAASSSTPSSALASSSSATLDPLPSASTSSTRPSTSSSAAGSRPNGSTSLPPLSPTPIHDALSSNPRFDAMRRGTQEDAEEFLGFFLETLSEEVGEIVKKEEERVARIQGGDKGKEKEKPQEEEEGWEEVGSKGRTATTRTTGETKESPITRIFGGKLRSVLRCPGQKDSVTIEPFQRLQLDIQPDHVRTIEDALVNLTAPESLPDFTTSRGIVTQDATKQVTLDELPPVLILHLKRFLYDEVGGVQKSTKKVGYGTQLRVEEKVVSPARRGKDGKEVARYELFGVVYHHGLQASGGHYTVSVRTAYHSPNWLELDDTHIRSMGPGEIAVNPDSTTSSASSTTGGGGRRRWEATAAMRDREGAFGAEEEHKGAYLLMYSRVDE